MTRSQRRLVAFGCGKRLAELTLIVNFDGMGKLMRSFARLFTGIPGVREWAYNTSRFPKLGLMSHDTIRMDTEVTREARARLPKQIAAERQFRVSRALYLDARQQILPKEEWMTLDKDIPYLFPYIRQVQNERREKTEYEAKLYTYKS